MDVIVNNWQEIDFEPGESGYTLQPLDNTTLSYDTSIVWSGSQSLKVEKTGTSSNVFGVFITGFGPYQLGKGRIAFQLYIPKEYEDVIRKIILEFYDVNGNYIRVSYLDKDSPTYWWGYYEVAPRWKEIICGLGRYSYYGLDFNNVNGVKIIFYTSNASDTPTVYIDRFLINYRIEVKNATGESFTIHDIANRVEAQGYPFIRRLSERTYLLRAPIYVDASNSDISFYISGVTLLVDELAIWTRYSLATIQTNDTVTGTLHVGDVITEYSPTNFLNYVQITKGYSWGVALLSGVDTQLDLNAFTITATNEHRIYYSTGTVSGLIANAAGIFPRGQYPGRYLKRSFYVSRGYGLWVHGVDTEGNVLMPSGSVAFRTEYLNDGAIRNFRVIGDHKYIMHYTFWSATPSAITYKFYNVLSRSPSGEVYAFQYTNTQLSGSHHIRHEAGMDVNIKILKTNGQPLEGAKVELYGAHSGKLWEAYTDANGETGIHETLVKWWEGDITTTSFTVLDDDMVDERPHRLRVMYKGSTTEVPISISFNDLPLQYTFAAVVSPKLVLDLKEISIILPSGDVVPILHL